MINLNKKLSNIDWSLYAIIDQEWLRGKPIQDVARRLVKGGAGIIQYRDKVSESGLFYRNAQKIRNVTSNVNIPFIVNDRVDIALAVRADGIHLGKKDFPIEVARILVGNDMIIGATVRSVQEFKASAHADYFGVGTIYPTDTKMDTKVKGISILKEIRSLTVLPVIGIGGINLNNVDEVIQAGADGVAVISAILGSIDIAKTASQFLEAVHNLKEKDQPSSLKRSKEKI
jgi:thiamine-phosphate pyrophosphorylase